MWTIFIVHLVGLISPGPDFFYVSRKAMAETRRSALFASVGIGLGVGFWALVVLFGLAFINKFLPSFQFILMVLGGSYLAYNGFKMLQIRHNAQIDETTQKVKTRSDWKELVGGLMINLSNPKVIIFFSSVLAGYMSNLSQINDIFLVLLMLVTSSIIYFWLVALLFSHRKIRQFYAKHNRYLDNFAGAVFLLFGGKLVYEGITMLLYFV